MGNVLGGATYGDIPLPEQHLLVVGCGGEPLVVVVEGDGVDGRQVVVVLLHHLACTGDTKKGSERM
jgi:hypothetical protein